MLEAAGRGDLSDLLSLHASEWQGFIPAGTRWLARIAVSTVSARSLRNGWTRGRSFASPGGVPRCRDSVVVMVRYWGRGKGSGVEVHDRGRAKTSGVDIEEMYAKGAAMFHVRDGKVTRLALYWEREHALADVGVKE